MKNKSLIALLAMLFSQVCFNSTLVAATETNTELNFELMDTCKGVFLESAQRQYIFARKLMKGEIKTFSKMDVTTYVFSIELLRAASTSTNPVLRSKALHNIGCCSHTIAEKFKEERSQEQATYYQEAYYYFSLANLEASQKNMGRLTKTGKITPLIDSTTTSKRPSIEARLKDGVTTEVEKYIDSILHAFPGLATKRQEIKEHLVAKAMHLVTAGQFHLAVEEAMSDFEALPKEMSFEDSHFEELELFLERMKFVSEETPLLPGQQKPTFIFIGRSLGWLIKFNEYSSEKLKSIHILASGLASEEPTIEQLVYYKQYLDSLGIAELARENGPLILADVAESGASLLRMKNILISLYPNLSGRIQFCAFMSSGQTINLPKARTLYISPSLAKILFAKHSGSAGYSPFPRFYPSSWSEWKEVSEIEPAAEAMELQSQMEDWFGRKK